MEGSDLKAAAADLQTPAGRSARLGSFAIAAAFAVVLAAHLHLALTRGINWDEFHYYDWIRQFHAGTLAYALQTFHARLFGWLLFLPGDVTDHIRTARVVMLACEAGAAIAIFGLAQRFASKPAAALVALAYLAGGYIVIHGTAFRTDPQATFLLATALWLLAAARLRPLTILAFGLMAGAATMVTIKVAFWTPAFAAIAWLRWRESPRKLEALRRIAACVGAGLAAFAALYAWQAASLPAEGAHAATSTVGSAGRVVFSEGLLPQWRALVLQLLMAPHITALLILTAVGWTKLAVSRDQRLAMIGLLLPLAVLLVYRNSYPYFFVFLSPPVLVATAPAMDIVVRRYGVVAPALLMALLAALLAWQQPRDVLPAQKRVIAVAHQLFPRPVTYFDFCGYLGDYDRALDFMPSGWGLTEYRRAARPVFAEVMDRKSVPLLILNHNVLITAISGKSRGEDLLEADARALRENYIRHWGMLWVAGKQIAAGAEPVVIDIRVPGPYTLERSEIVLDGIPRKPGETFKLDRGLHRIAGSRPDQATLRWGERLKAPAAAPPEAGPYATLD